MTGVAAALLVAAGGVIWTTMTPPQFTATSVFSLRPDPEEQSSADILLITAHEYVAYVSSPQAMSVAAEGSGIGAEGLRSRTGVSVENGTTNVRIDVTLLSSAAAVSAANELASVAVTEGQADRLVEVKVVSLATVDSTKITPSRRLLFIITGILSVLIGCLVWYVVGRRVFDLARLGF